MIMNGNVPTLISGVPNVASSLAMIRSHASAMPSAPASTCPRAAHSVGLPSCAISLNRPVKRSEAKCLSTSGASAPKPPRLAPEENVLSFEERSTTQRTLGCSRARSNAPTRPPSSSGESALRVSGSLSVIVATPESAAYRTLSVSTVSLATGASYPDRDEVGSTQRYFSLLGAWPGQM